MYGLYGISHNVCNIYKLSARFRNDAAVTTANELKPYYLHFIDHYYQNPPINHRGPIFIQNTSQARELLKYYSASLLNDLSQDEIVGQLYTDSKLALANQRIQNALDDLTTLDRELSQLFNLVIHSIVVSDSNNNKNGQTAHGGSTSNLIGLIWLTLNKNLSDQDICELLIHELTHTLVFIDELNFGHFDYENIAKKEFWARSTILNRPRPIDKVLHSIVVGTEILHARHTFLQNTDKLRVHPDTATLKANALASIDSVLNLRHLQNVCLPRAIEIIEKSRDYLKKM